MKKRIISLFLALIIVTAGVIPAGASGMERTAQALAFDVERTFSITGTANADFKVTTEVPGALLLNINSNAKGLRIDVYDSNGIFQKRAHFGATVGTINSDGSWSTDFSGNLLEWSTITERASGWIVFDVPKGTYYIRTYVLHFNSLNVITCTINPMFVQNGDVNSNGKTDVEDALEILKYIAGLPNVITNNASRLVVADVNGDGKIDVQDALEILRHVAGLPSLVG